jgi:hypothetical protein
MKRQGNLYEQIFFTEALKHGLEVFTPLGDYLPQDCIVMNQAGRPFKVQIKGTGGLMKEGRGGLGRYMVTAATGSKEKDPIDCTKVDVMAAYVEPKNCWYLIPCLYLSGIRITLCPHNPQSRGKYEKFLECWDVFKIN